MQNLNIDKMALINSLKKSWILVVLLCLFSEPTTVSATEDISEATYGTGGKLLLKDFFTDSKNRHWTFYNRKGRIANGSLWMDGGYTSGSIGRDGWILTHVGDTTWKDYRYSFTFNNENTSGSPRNHHMVTAYFRVASESGNNRKTMYRLDVWNPKDVQEGGPCPGWEKGAVGLYKSVDGVGYVLKDTCIANTTTGTNFMSITVSGGDIKVRINGRTVLRYTDPDPIPYGGVGVGEIWEIDGWYDNISVRTLLPPEKAGEDIQDD
jgi:hypothetical protein